MTLRGVTYDTGTEYRPGESSRPLWHDADVLRDLRVIRDALHASSVGLYGTNLERLVEAARLAHQEKLHVALQLRSIDEPRAEMLERVILYTYVVTFAASLLLEKAIPLAIGP